MNIFIATFIWTLQLGAASTSTVSACGGDKAQKEMGAHLFKNQEYRQFVCGEEACTQPEFQTNLEFREEVLCEKSSTTGCFVEPHRKASNYYSGFFLITGGKVSPQFVFFGIGLGTTKQSKVKIGCKSVSGRERIDRSTWMDHVFEWDGSSYVETDSQTRQ